MDGNLDDRLAGMFDIRWLRCGRATNATFDQQFEVNRTGSISPETVSKRMIETLDIERLAAAGVRAIQEWAVLALGLHRFELPTDGCGIRNYRFNPNHSMNSLNSLQTLVSPVADRGISASRGGPNRPRQPVLCAAKIDLAR